MKTYLNRSGYLMRQLWPSYIWSQKNRDTVYITFDDGPHPTITSFVLEQLKVYNAKATFFCIGKNVLLYPDVYTQILDAGHSIGNHTHNHLNGWKTPTKIYLKNVLKATQCINTLLFRPPYGRIKSKQAQMLIKKGYKIVMWSLLTGDFDTELTPEKCWDNIAGRIRPGDIIVFHDSEKAWDRLQYCLPKLLAFCSERNLKMEALSL